jgi:hypothetical protein
MPPMLSHSMQQPSPEGSLSMSSGMTTIIGMPQGVDTLSGGEQEFDLDSIWNCSQNTSNLSTVMHPHPGTFGSYGLGLPQIHPTATGPTVMYHPSTFR